MECVGQECFTTRARARRRAHEPALSNKVLPFSIHASSTDTQARRYAPRALSALQRIAKLHEIGRCIGVESRDDCVAFVPIEIGRSNAISCLAIQPLTERLVGLLLEASPPGHRHVELEAQHRDQHVIASLVVRPRHGFEQRPRSSGPAFHFLGTTPRSVRVPHP